MSARHRKLQRRRMAQKAVKIIRLVFATFIISIVFNLVSAWFDTHSVNFRWPIVVEYRQQELVSPLPKEAGESGKLEIKIATPSATPTPTVKPTTRGVSIVKQAEAKSPERVIEGQASYYSRAGCLGCSQNLTMANGEALSDEALTLAMTPEMVSQHKLLNDMVLVQNIANGKTVMAKVTDTGGFGKYNRVADLSLATKNAISCRDLCNVKITY